MLYSIGAYDRFNFGDLLFPHILEQVAEVPVSHLTTTESDLRARGGVLATTPKAVKLLDGDALVIAGGDVLSASWLGVWWHLQPEWYDGGLRVINRVVPGRLLEWGARRALGGVWGLPFVPPREVTALLPTAFNAVSGSGLDSLPRSSAAYIRDALGGARYVSVRDRATQVALASLGRHATLAPDSAALLGLRARPANRSERNLVFQASDQWMRRWAGPVAVGLRELERSGWTIKFLRIGQAAGHSDARALARLRSLGCHVLEEAAHTVDQISAAIANATAFVGSSLHGHIVSVASGTPCVALPGVAKLEDYVQTWTASITEVARDLTNLPALVRRMVELPRDQREEKRMELAEAARANTEELLGAVG